MRDHEPVRADDFDPIDEESLEVHKGHPADVIVSVRFTPDESRLLSELAELEGSDEIGTLCAALHEYAARRSDRAPG